MNRKQMDNHFFVTSGNDIDELIKPLKAFFGITGFIYKKNFGNGKFIRLANISDFSADFYKENLYKYCLLDCDPSCYQSGLTTWDQIFVNDGQIIQDVAAQYDMNQGVVLTIRSAEIVEHISLGISKHNHQAISKIFNNIDLLERFFLYFKERGSDLLKSAEKHTLKLSGYDQKLSKSQNAGIFSHNEFDRDEFLKATHVTKLSINENTSLSRRELDCGLQLLQGKTCAEIAEGLFLSPRTVETHIISLKSKLEAGSKSELIGALINNGFGTNGKISLLGKNQ